MNFSQVEPLKLFELVPDHAHAHHIPVHVDQDQLVIPFEINRMLSLTKVTDLVSYHPNDLVSIELVVVAHRRSNGELAAFNRVLTTLAIRLDSEMRKQDFITEAFETVVQSLSNSCYWGEPLNVSTSWAGRILGGC